MNITFVLRDDKKKDGTQTIRCYIRHNGRAYYNTDYSVYESEFKNGRVKESRANAALINSYIIRLRNEVEALCISNPSLSAKDIVKLIGKGSANTFLSFFENFIRDCENGSIKRSLGTVKNYKKVKKALDEFEVDTDFNRFSKTWYDAYLSYLRKKGMNENSIGGHVKVVKSVLNEAYDKGVSTCIEHKKKYFKKPSQETDSIYLSKKEIELWRKVDLSNYGHLQAERDRFLIQYYFILRFGDTLRINESNFYSEDDKLFFKIRSEKTSTETILPVSKNANTILKKYDYKLPYTTNYEANENLKKIGALAKINSIVSISGVKREKSYFISTHTARRSGATHLYLDGVPEKVIMDLGGWKRVEEFRKYIRLTKLESAKKALKYNFFK